MRFAGDHARHGVNGGKVGLAVFERRGAHADENGIGDVNGRGQITGEFDAPRRTSPRDQFLEVRLADRDLTGKEGTDVLSVAIHTIDLVADGGQASARHQPYVTAADD